MGELQSPARSRSCARIGAAEPELISTSLETAQDARLSVLGRCVVPDLRGRVFVGRGKKGGENNAWVGRVLES